MYAILETGGLQFKVSKGEILKIPKLGIEPKEEVVFEKIRSFDLLLPTM